MLVPVGCQLTPGSPIDRPAKICQLLTCGSIVHAGLITSCHTDEGTVWGPMASLTVPLTWVEAADKRAGTNGQLAQAVGCEELRGMHTNL